MALDRPVSGSKIKVGFRASIIALFVGVVLLVGLALVYLSFSRVSRITRSAATSFLDTVAQLSADRIDAQLKTVRDSLDILRGLTSVQSADIRNNQRLYIVLASMLRNNPQLYNLYMGYDDGSFLEMDFIDRVGAAARARIEAPDGAKFRMVILARSGDSNGPVSFIRFLSDSLATITELPGPASYDPRQRPWFKGAYEPDAGLLTEPYVFFATGEAGYTLRQPIIEGHRGVVAGDMLLSVAQTMLRKQQLGQSGIAFLFDEAGRVLAHPDMTRLMATARVQGRADGLPRLSDIDTIGMSGAIAAWRKSGAAQQFFEDRAGRTYAAAFRPVAFAGSANLRLGIFAPVDEFYATIENERRALFVAAIAFVLAVLPIAFALGSMLSRSMRMLARETEAIQHFRFTNAPQLHSPIREIDDLGRSVFRMRALVQAFSNFVPKRLVQQLVETGDAIRLGGARREVTVLFTDVVNFTGITEHRDPARVMLFTSRYFAALSEAIMANKGTVDKFIGDAVMGIWNAPVADADHVANACTAVLACIKANRELNAEFEREGWPVYNTRFGLHTGEAVVGNIGSPDRMNYTVLGAAVNLAARLESLNKNYGTTVLVSEAVKSRVEAFFTFRSVDRIKPKGFAAKVQIYELLGERDSGRTDAAAWRRQPKGSHC
jgi:adenylate cyclase